jgi:3-oxoadipate enol-lactonase
VNVTHVGDAAIAWEDHGPVDAATVVLCHSLGYDHDMWLPQIEALAASYRVIAIDMRGHGASDAPQGPYDMAMLGGDVVTVADSAGVDSFAVCGLSIGGQIALWLGINAADRLWALAACNTAARIGTVEGWADRVAQVQTDGMQSLVDAARTRWWSPDFPQRNPGWAERGLTCLATTSPVGYIGCCHALAASDLSGEVTGITTPTLVVGGSLDQSTTPAAAEWLHSHIPASELTIIEGAAHVSNLDRPERFTEALQRFLEDR